jgi:hypothetical protein
MALCAMGGTSRRNTATWPAFSVQVQPLRSRLSLLLPFLIRRGEVRQTALMSCEITLTLTSQVFPR